MEENRWRWKQAQWVRGVSSQNPGSNRSRLVYMFGCYMYTILYFTCIHIHMYLVHHFSPMPIPVSPWYHAIINTREPEPKTFQNIIHCILSINSSLPDLLR